MVKVRGFAPATIANIGGFDVGGVALDEPGDEVEVEFTSEFKGVRLVEIVNQTGLPTIDLPYGPKNVVEAVGQKLWASIQPRESERYGVKVKLYKNMKIGTGMGSSASSEAAVAIALLELLGWPLDMNSKPVLEVLVYGEEVATGSPHPDNVLPSFLGGALFIYDADNLNYIRFEGKDEMTYPSICFAVVSPDLRLDTREMRQVLPKTRGLVALTRNLLKEKATSDDPINFEVSNYSDQIKAVAAETNVSEETVVNYLICSLKEFYGIKYNIPPMLGDGVLQENIITSRRAPYIRGFDSAREAALATGAHGFSISGSGPSLFSVTSSVDQAYLCGEAMVRALEKHGVKAVPYVSTINNQGARIV